MLQRLFIKNLVLIEECEIFFSDKFNVLTGETGSGKSVVLSSLSFLMGNKIDTSMIRKGKDECSVEATFVASKELSAYLETIGISKDDEDITILRKLNHSGKTKNFINNQSVQINVLKHVLNYLIESCSQHAHIELLKNQMPALHYDAYIDAEKLRQDFQNALKYEKDCHLELQNLLQNENERFRTIDTLKREIEEIETLDLQEHEDEELFQAIEHFYKQKEMNDAIEEILLHIDSEGGIFSKLNALKGRFEKLSDTHNEARQLFFETVTNLKDLVFHLAKGQNAQEESISEREVRLKKIDDLKRKYGSTIEEILEWQNQQKEKLFVLQHIDDRIEVLREQVQIAKETTNILAKELSIVREKFLQSFSDKMTQELRALNLPKATFDVELIKCNRSELGDEKIHFFLTPNQGEKRIDVQDHASGGELSRIALCLQKLNSHKNATPTLLFDEIDANVGGTTANEIAKKLCSIADTKQIICITHFPQVAKMANAHFRILKKEIDNRTVSMIEFLSDKKAIQNELDRMIGGIVN